MAFIYSEEDQFLINSFKKRCRDYEKSLLKKLEQQEVEPEQFSKLFMQDETRNEMRKSLVKLIQTMVPTGYEI